MRRSTLLAALLVAASVAGADPARLAYVESTVERAPSPDAWEPAREATGFAFGDELRVLGTGLARLRFPWMSATLGPDAKVSLPATGVLALRLDRGRLAVDSPERDTLPIATPQAEIRGRGRVVVRAKPEETLVMAHAGRFEVVAGGRSVWLDAGTGTVVPAGGAPGAARALPPPPRDLTPGDDALYVDVNQPASLRWTSDAPAHWVELLPVGGDEVLLQSGAGASTLGLRIPWPGAFRWRVASVDASGLEGKPSDDGLVCAVE